MSQSKEVSSRPELLFLDFDIDDLKGPKLPTNGDVLRYYFNRRHLLPNETNRSVARMTVSKCMKIWQDNGIPTTSEGNGIKKLEKMLLEFNRMKCSYKRASESQRQKKSNMWRQKYELLFIIAAKDAHEKCNSVENREKLLAAQKKSKEFSAAVTNNTLMEVPQKKDKSALNLPNGVTDDRLNNNEETSHEEPSHEELQNKANPGPSETIVTPKLKEFNQLENNEVMNSPNQNLREQLKQQGWVYMKKNPRWKLAVVVPPFKLFV